MIAYSMYIYSFISHRSLYRMYRLYVLRTLAGPANQPLFSVILSRSIYLCMFVRRFSPPKTAGQPLDTWRDVSEISVYRHAVGIRNIFPSTLCGCH